MEKFVAYEKMSKKQQKLVNASKRGSWGNVKPITKVKASAKVYNRKKEQGSRDYGYSFGSLCNGYYFFEKNVCKALRKSNGINCYSNVAFYAVLFHCNETVGCCIMISRMR